MNVPQLRFEGFYGEWKETFVKDTFSEVRNGFVGTATPFYVEEGIPYLQSNNVKNNKINKKKMVYINEEFHKKNKKSILRKSDIVMVQSGHAGECAVIEEEFAGTNCHALIVMTPNSKTNAHFFSYYINSSLGQKKLYKLITGNTIRHILASDIKKYAIKMPGKEEQLKISSFFSLLERKIEKQQEKIEKLEQFKKGMMQKIFSQELRFKDEDGREFPDWKDTTFGEISQSMQYGMNAAAKDFDGENKYIRITDIDESSRRYIENGRVSPLGKLSEEYRIKQGDILFARTGASTGKSYLYRESDGKMYYAGFLIRLRVREGVDSRFVYYQTLLKEYDQWVKVMSMRSGQPGINAQEYSSYEFKLPNLEEQTRIADFLDGIENKIEKEKEKLMVLEEQKKGFMQGMFV